MGNISIANIMRQRGAKSRHAGKPRKTKEGKISITSGFISDSMWRKILLSTRTYGTVIMNTTRSDFKHHTKKKSDIKFTKESLLIA